MDGLALITESDKDNAIASKFSLAHENSSHSDQSASVQDSCSALNSDVFNDDSSSYTSPRDGKAPGGDSVVISIPKPGKDPSNPSNYRPISLLSCISKVFERIILKRLNRFVSTQNVLPNHQFGIRAAHSTSHQLNRVVRHCKNKRGLGQSTEMLFFKLSQRSDFLFESKLL
jgi:hypothetical protein